MGNGGGRGRSGSANAILLGLGLGIACGLFIGEPAGHLGVLADAFIRLLQMAVLPYITVSLTAAVGRLSAREARVVLARIRRQRDRRIEALERELDHGSSTILP